MKRIRVGRKIIGRGDRPLLCTPLVGRTRAAVLEEMAGVVPKQPDLIEWRVDFFESKADVAAVIDLASEIKAAAGGIPIIFACRMLDEGGGASPLNDSDILKLFVAACASRCVDAIDYEMSNPAFNVTMLRQASREAGVTMIMSYHNHQFTPDGAELAEKFVDAERLGADVAKVIVMPNGSEDVLALLDATLKASKKCRIPLVSMSMGGLGSLSRVFGWVYGSAVTFAAGMNSSAPGQMSIEELRPVLKTVHQAVQGG